MRAPTYVNPRAGLGSAGGFTLWPIVVDPSLPVSSSLRDSVREPATFRSIKAHGKISAYKRQLPTHVRSYNRNALTWKDASRLLSAVTRLCSRSRTTSIRPPIKMRFG